MKVLIISDSHGREKLLHKIVKYVSANHIIHCGDFCTNSTALPQNSLTYVKGNCDFEDIPEEAKWDVGGILFYVIHGHQYHVKETIYLLKERAEEIGAQIVCFGHSHIPFCKKLGDTLFINPGSISQPRRFPFPTYACVQMMKRKVKVTYFKTDGQLVRQRGGTFDL